MAAASEPSSELQLQLALKILHSAMRLGLRKGEFLREQKLSEEFKVSRSPIRAAMSFLSSRGILKHVPNKGYYLERDAFALNANDLNIPPSEEELAYSRIAADWFAKSVPENITELELRRRYRFSGSALSRALTRLSHDGIIAQSPGYGWRFLQTLDSAEASDESYRFRIAIETAAILEPGFRLDRERAAWCRANHDRILSRDLRRVPISALFDIDAEFHELIARSSNNRFILSAVESQNRLRRLTEYFSLDVERAAISCREHLDILTALEEDRRKKAAELLHRHLEDASRIKPAYTKQG
jgi:DNA-binding GntR family transcriptional regulator